MAANSRRVFYVHEVADPVYLEVMATEDSIQIDKLENGTTLTRRCCWPIGASSP
jgi:hypothetical protein